MSDKKQLTCIECDRTPSETEGVFYCSGCALMRVMGAQADMAGEIVADIDDFTQTMDLDDMDPCDPVYIALTQLHARRDYYQSQVMPS